MTLIGRIASSALVLFITILPTADGEDAPVPGVNGATCRNTVSAVGRPALDSVVWRLAPDPDRHAQLQQWCGTVGPVVLEQHPASPDAIGLDSLAVITWNTHVGGGDIARLVNDLQSGALTGAPVSNFVLLLQEVYRTGAEIPDSLFGMSVPGRIATAPQHGDRTDIVNVARALNLNVLYAPSMRNGPQPNPGAEDRGNAILSPLRLHAPGAFELPFQIQRRVALIARVVGNTSSGSPWLISLANVHFDTRASFPHMLATTGGARRAQATGLLKMLPDDPAIVLAGDLNTWALGVTETAVPYLKQAFPQTPNPVIGNTFYAGRFGRRLDYMFFKLPNQWTATYRRIDDRYGSDHHPLIAWVKFTS